MENIFTEIKGDGLLLGLGDRVIDFSGSGIEVCLLCLVTCFDSCLCRILVMLRF